MTGRSDIIDIACEIRAETEKAWKIYDGAREAWIPKSQAEWDADSKTMAMPEWLAKDKELI